MRANKREKIAFVLFSIIILLGIGYAYLSTNLSIDGISNITRANWNVHLENVQVTQGSVTTVTQAPTINSDLISINYAITLNEPGDFYEFTVDVKNSGTIDAMIETVTSTVNGVSPSELPNYLNYSATYSNGIEIASNHILEANTKETYKIRLEYNQDINPEDLPQTDQIYNIVLAPKIIQKTAAAKPVPNPEDFSTDSWETIQAAARSGNACNYYNIGDTRQINMGDLGTHTLRIANCSTPNECNNSSFSQTACGLVLEFVDIISMQKMNTTDTSVGGWRDSELRGYISNTIYNSLPSELQDTIINTNVISGRSPAESSSIVTTDKIYLLSITEVMKPRNGSSIPNYDSAWNLTRQLDYYKNNNVTDDNYSGCIKKNGTTNERWWLRSAYQNMPYYFFAISQNGVFLERRCSYEAGVSPAFRIG